MKKTILLAALFTGSVFINDVKAQQITAPDPTVPIITFEKDTIDYGTMIQDDDGYRYFKFTNTGKEPLIIREAHGSCGCLVPSWPPYPIQPGQSNKIRVHYDTHRIGFFTKSITVTSNANPPTHILIIRGKVLLPEVSQSPTINK